jgi:hypothetical protein
MVTLKRMRFEQVPVVVALENAKRQGQEQQKEEAKLPERRNGGKHEPIRRVRNVR